jgi:hypothetical protein
MGADMGAIGGSKDQETLITADTAYGAQMKDTEEPIPDWAVGVVKGFCVTVRTDLSI